MKVYKYENEHRQIVFTATDPRPSYKGSVEEVELDTSEYSASWPPATARPDNIVGQSGTTYKVFRFTADLAEAGFSALGKYWPTEGSVKPTHES